MQDRDSVVIGYMLEYCREIDITLHYFGASEESFRENCIFRNSVSMCLLQIGELARKLSPEFVAEHPEQPWYKMRGMRNVVAHEYGTIDFETLWNTVTKNIPSLFAYCAEYLGKTE